MLYGINQNAASTGSKSHTIGVNRQDKAGLRGSLFGVANRKAADDKDCIFVPDLWADKAVSVARPEMKAAKQARKLLCRLIKKKRACSNWPLVLCVVGAF